VITISNYANDSIRSNKGDTSSLIDIILSKKYRLNFAIDILREFEANDGSNRCKSIFFQIACNFANYIRK